MIELTWDGYVDLFQFHNDTINTGSGTKWSNFSLGFQFHNDTINTPK